MNHISSTQHRPHGLGLVAVALLALSLGALRQRACAQRTDGRQPGRS